MLNRFSTWWKNAGSRAARRRADRATRRKSTPLRVEVLEAREVMNGDPLGPEQQVNTTLAGDQELLRETKQAVASDAAGNYIVVWQAANQAGGNGFDIYARRYNAAGVALGDEFRINSYTSGGQQGASVAMDADGDFVVVWHTGGFPGGNGSDVVARRFDANGTALGDDFLVNSYTTGTQQWATVAMDVEGDFVVAWMGSGQPGGSSSDVYARRYSAAGTALGDEFRVNTYTTSTQNQASVAMDGDGDFVVVWTSSGQTGGSGLDVFGQRFDASGVAQGSEFRVNSWTSSTQSFASVAMSRDAASGFVVVWNSMNQAYNPSGYDVYAKRYSASGVELGSEFRVNEYSQSWQAWPTVAMAAGGDFVVGWSGLSQPGGQSYDVYARRFSAAGSPLTGEFRVNEVTTNYQRYQSVAIGAEGSVVAAWSSDNTTTGDFGNVAVRRFNSQLRVQAVRLPTGETLFEDDHLTDGPTALVVGFNRAASTIGGAAGAGSVLNPAHWRLTRNGLDVSANIAGVSALGLNAVTGLWEVAIEFVGPQPPGVYELVALDSIQTETGAALDGDADGQVGGDFVRGFVIDAPVAPRLGVVSVETSDSNVVDENETLAARPAGFVVTFDAEASTAGGTTGANSVLNPNNWTLLRDDAAVVGAIASVTFGFDATTNAWRAVVALSAPLGEGSYRLVLSDAVQSAAGDGLDGDGDGLAGGDFARSFVVDLPRLAVVETRPPGAAAPLAEDSVLAVRPTSLVVSFSGELSTVGGATGANSVTNRANWRLTRYGGDESSRISSVSYYFDAATGVSQATVHFVSALPDATYELTARGSLRSVDGIALDGDGDGLDGGDFVRGFFVNTPAFNVNVVFDASSGEIIEGETLTAGPTMLGVVFDAPPSTVGGTTGANSVVNPNNWRLTRDGIDVSDAISLISDLGYNEVIGAYLVWFNLDAALPQGAYELTAFDAIQSTAGRTLDGDDDGLDGGDFVRGFAIDLPNLTVVQTRVAGSTAPLVEDAVLPTGPAGVVVAFSHPVSTTGGTSGADSVTNPANWSLTRDGIDVSSRITGVSYGYNSATRRYEATVSFDAALGFGRYEVTARDAIRSTLLVGLDGDSNGTDGGDFVRGFRVQGAPPTTVLEVFDPETLAVVEPGQELTQQPQSLNVLLVGDPDVSGPADPQSVFNLANYRLTRNGVVVAGAIAEIVAVDSAAGDWIELSIVFAEPLVNGDYVLTLLDSIHSTPGDALDGNGDGIYGGDFAFGFSVNAPAALGPEFRVNVTTSGTQRLATTARRAIASDAAGNYVIVWQGLNQVGGNGSDVYLRRYDATGQALGGEVRVNSYTTGTQTNAAVAMDADGDFVVVWTGNGQPGGSSDDVYAQRFDNSGAKVGGEFRVNSYTSGSQFAPTVAMDADGDFVVVWTSGVTQPGGNLSDVYAKRFDSSGTPQSAEFRVNTHTTGTQDRASVAIDADGDFVVAWTSTNQPGGSGADVFARLFDPQGVATGSEFRVNVVTSGSQAGPSVAMDADGDFVVVWTGSFGGSGYDVYGRRFDVAGTPLEGEFRVNTRTVGAQKDPTVAMDADGDFVVAWTGPDRPGEINTDVYARRFTATGPVGDDFRVNTSAGSNQEAGGVAFGTAGSFVVAGSSAGMVGGNGYDVFARHYAEPLAVAGVWTPDGAVVDSGATLAAPPTGLVIAFNLPASTLGGAAGATSVLNPANWSLIRNGSPVAVVVASYGFNAGTGRFEATLTFAAPLEDGDYQLALFDSVTTAAGQPLDGDDDALVGGDFTLSFAVEAV